MGTNIALAGIASVTIDGTPVKLVSGLTYSTSTTERETAIGMDGIHGFTSKNVSGKMAFTVRLTADQPISDYDNITGSTIVAQLVNTSTVSGFGMWITSVAEGDAAEGTAALHFEGVSVSVD